MFAAAAIEIVLCHGWATGRVPYQKDMFATPLLNLLWILGITHWRTARPRPRTRTRAHARTRAA